jgi:hypothetical protein
MPSLSDMILDYFKQHANQPLSHDDYVDIISEQYAAIHGKPPRDPWRATRKLHQDGYLIKVAKGIYMYDPDFITNPQLEDFTPQQKAIILERDGYRCVMCGRGEAEGATLHIDHIKPKDKGGKATLENGQTLCAEHNLLKKTSGQTESGKRMFISLLRTARQDGDAKLEAFCVDILRVYDKHNMNGHVEWDEA